MKKIAFIVFLSGLILVVASVYLVTRINYAKIKQNNMTIQEQIKNIDTQKQKENDLGIKLNDDLVNLEKKLNKEINEYDVWIKTKEKLSSITS